MWVPLNDGRACNAGKHACAQPNQGPAKKFDTCQQNPAILTHMDRAPTSPQAAAHAAYYQPLFASSTYTAFATDSPLHLVETPASDASPIRMATAVVAASLVPRRLAVSRLHCQLVNMMQSSHVCRLVVVVILCRHITGTEARPLWQFLAMHQVR